MHQNILNKRSKKIDSKLYNGNYYDFMLYGGDSVHFSEDYINDLSIVDFSTLDIVNGILYSTTTWGDAVNNGVLMEDIGFTGVDNGLISFDKTAITNEQFLKLYLNSEFSINSGDTRFFMTPVNGNTRRFKYPLFLIENEDEKYIACKGGFYQGFFKLDGFEYQVLPHKIDNEWVMHFDIRPRSDYSIEKDSVNKEHPKNAGIFFYMGTRAENKFWPYYKTNPLQTDSLKKENAINEGYFTDNEYIGENNIVFQENNWLANEPIIEEVVEEECPEPYRCNDYFAFGDDYFISDEVPIVEALSSKTETIVVAKNNYPVVKNYLNIYGYNPYGYCDCIDCDKEEPIKIVECEGCTRDYYADEYWDKPECPPDNGKVFVDEYIGSGMSINPNGYSDSDGHAPDKRGYHSFTSDNKFLLFNRTDTGYTINTWNENATITFETRKDWPDANYFLLMNRTKTGYTIDSIDSYNETNSKDFNIYNDLKGNAFALRITENGAVGYRYGVLDCSDDNPNKYKVIEEYTKDNMVKMDEWNSVNVRFVPLTPRGKCYSNKGAKMKILIYVNGFLKLISKEVDAFEFKRLDDVYQKQNAVPYNISLGGGTLGLMETILPNYYLIPDYVLPLEKDFCGTFLGDIKSFKMYEGFIDYSSVLNYL